MVLVALTGLSAAEVAGRGGLPAQTVSVQQSVDTRWLQGFVAAVVALPQL